MSMDQHGTGGMPSEHGTFSPSWEQPPQKKGLSCGCMLLIFAVVVGGLLVVLCCGGFGLIGWYAANSVSEDPDQVASVTRKIAQIDVPEGLEPTASCDFQIPFTDGTAMIWVVYVDQQTGSILTLGALTGMFAAADQDDMRQQIEASMDQGRLPRYEGIRDWEHYEKEVEVRGQQVSFSFAVGTDEDSGVKRIQVDGTFQGESGPVMFSFDGDAEKYDEQTIIKTLESIR